MNKSVCKHRQNTECEYFPCHEIDNPEEFNCLFCFCPLYALGQKCGGDFSYTESGVKDCSKCTIPHRVDSYEFIISKIVLINEMMESQKDTK